MARPLRLEYEGAIYHVTVRGNDRRNIFLDDKDEFDAAGLNYYGYRFYNPVIGRWINRDPIGENDGFNLFAFVGNNPVHEIDPLGLSLFGNLPPPVQGPFKPPVKGGVVGGVCYAVWCTMVNYDDYLECLEECADDLGDCLTEASAKCPPDPTGPCYVAYAGCAARCAAKIYW